MHKTAFSPTLAMIGMTGLIVLAAGMTSAIAAEPAPEKHETVIVKVIQGDHGPSNPEAMVMANCGGEKPTIDTSSETKGPDGKVKRSHIIICNKADGAEADNASVIKRLQSARVNIAGITELTPEAKAKALASLDEEIARLSAAK